MNNGINQLSTGAGFLPSTVCSYIFSSLSCHEVLSRQLERQGTCQITVWLNKFWGREDLTEDLFETWNPSEECKAELKA